MSTQITTISGQLRAVIRAAENLAALLEGSDGEFAFQRWNAAKVTGEAFRLLEALEAAVISTLEEVSEDFSDEDEE